MYSYRARFIFAVFAILLSLGVAIAALHDFSEINTADSTQKMYEDFNKAFLNHWRARTGVEVTVKQARSKSGVPIRAVVDGLDVVSLALSYDPVALQKSSKFMLPHWVKPVPQNTPFTSTIVFLVRKGNPKGLRDWADLTRSDGRGGHIRSKKFQQRALELPGGVGLCVQAVGRKQYGSARVCKEVVC